MHIWSSLSHRENSGWIHIAWNQGDIAAETLSWLVIFVVGDSGVSNCIYRCLNTIIIALNNISWHYLYHVIREIKRSCLWEIASIWTVNLLAGNFNNDISSSSMFHTRGITVLIDNDIKPVRSSPLQQIPSCAALAIMIFDQFMISFSFFSSFWLLASRGRHLLKPVLNIS